MSDILKIVSDAGLENSDLWLNEAKFGFKYIQRYCSDLEANSTVLEVGCGSGILMAMLSEASPTLLFEGIEPFGDGFQSLAALNSFIKSKGVTIYDVGFEKFETRKKYDLIYLVNVFEHFDSWPVFLKFIEQHLSECGVCVVLCPNYNVPYESHFGIPIIFTKRLTEKVFASSIDSYEKKHNCPGLWNSLNFVKLSEVKKKIKTSGLSLGINQAISEDLIERFSSDDEFRKRHRIVGWLGMIIAKLGLVKLLRFRFFQNFQPYMMLEFRLETRP